MTNIDDEDDEELDVSPETLSLLEQRLADIDAGRARLIPLEVAMAERDLLTE